MSEHIIGRDINRKDEAAIKKGLSMADGGHVDKAEYHYEEVQDQFVKLIEFCKMDKKLRAVMLLRLVHGFTTERMQKWLFFHGHFLGNSREELAAMETEGKRLMNEALKRHTIQEIVSTINANSRTVRDLQNEMGTPKIITGLS